ncbi:MAG: porin [Nitrospinae bacterium]|nr:porin [Nitrospinota bacterium]
MKRFTTKCILFLFNFAVLAGYAQAAEVALKVLDGVELHAFASSSYTFNFNQPTQRPPNSATNVNRIFDADHNSFKFDVGELVILRDTPKPGDVGFRTDLTYGFSVPEVTQSTADTGDGQSHQFDVQQAYVSYNAPIGSGLQIDFGKFITHIGAEVIEGYDGWNYNFSRSFLFGLAIPFTHTGIRASYTINDMISVMGMVANGWDITVDNNDGKTLGAQIAITPTDNISLLLNWASGQEAIGLNGVAFSNNTVNIFDVVLDVGLTNNTLVQLNFDYGVQANGAVSGRDAEWWGIAGILRHNYNKWFSISLRGEFFDDVEGTRTTSATTLVADQGQELWEITVTPEVRINQNMVVRMEYRHDKSNQKAFFDSGAGKTQDTQDTIALNALFYF